MSTDMTAEVASDALDESLTEIDSRAKDLTGSGTTAIGPFGVLRFESEQLTPDLENTNLDNVDMSQDIPADSQWMTSFDPFMNLD